MSGVKILIFLTDDHVAADLEAALRTCGFAVCGPATTGGDAWARAERERPDLVLMDMLLTEERDGLEAADRISSRLGIPIVFLTKSDDEAPSEQTRPTLPCSCLLDPAHKRNSKTTIEMALRLAQVDAERRRSEADLLAERNRAERYLDIAGVIMVALDSGGSSP